MYARQIACGLIALLGLAVGCSEADAQPGTSAPGAPAQACLAQPSVRRTQILDDSNIVFVTHDDQAFLNRLPAQCLGLRRNSLVSYATDTPEYCAGMPFQVLLQVSTNSLPTSGGIGLPAPVVPGRICRLGTFEPVTKDAVDALVEATKSRSRRRERRAATEQNAGPPASP